MSSIPKSNAGPGVWPNLAGGQTTRSTVVVVLAALAILMDGFDNQVLGIALPSLMKSWSATRASFGPVFAVGFFGMILGTVVGGRLGDAWGRRAGLILAVAVFGVGTGATAVIDTTAALAVCRFVAGFGLGATLPSATSLLAENVPLKHRHIAVTLGIVCIPLGGVLGGFIAAPLLPLYGWRPLFAVGGILPLMLVVTMFFSCAFRRT